MKRTVNLRALVILLIGGVVLGGSLYLAHRVQVRRNGQALLTQADQAEAEGQSAQAADYVWQYLGLNPRNKEALARYALLIEKSGRGQKQKLRVLFLFDQVLRS